MSAPPILLTREQFRITVLARDGGACVFCGKPATDAHHILERRLWPDGGYYLSNGASVCAEHHIACEATAISVEEVREACGIRQALIPPHLYDDLVYDKWGNPILSNGTRLKGELFHDESVQKILASGGALALFSSLVKYPRTHHLPWSESVSHDDRMLSSTSQFEGREVVATEKMDGENTSLYRDYIHARSLDGRSHPSRDWVKGFWSRMKHEIPEGWRVCGENLYAKHSIAYGDLPTFFMGFSIWNERNLCLSWAETLEWFELLGVTPVPTLFHGLYGEPVIRALWNPRRWRESEGYVLRLAEPIPYADFKTKVAKFVRKDHLQTTKHWMVGQRIEANQLHNAVGEPPRSNV
jgi:hypothetical protein